MKDRIWFIETYNPKREEWVVTGNFKETRIEADALRLRLDQRFPRTYKRRIAQYMRLAKQ